MRVLKNIVVFSCCVLIVLLPVALHASDQKWNWKVEPVDDSGRFSSMAVDAQGNVHMSYVTQYDQVKYAFRDSHTSKWFKMDIDNAASFTSLTLDSQGNPHICYTQRTMRYASWTGSTWKIEQISPGAGAIAYYCSVGVSPQGVPHVTWYQERTSDDLNFLHIRYAVLENGVWLAQTLDFGAQTGKWETMKLDSAGNPHVSYDSFVSGQLKYAYWDGKDWNIHPIDARNASNEAGRGMGNSLVLDSRGRAMISYFEDSALKYARQTDDGWSIEKIVDVATSPSWAGYRTSQALDSNGLPHIAFQKSGTVAHAWWDSQSWHVETISDRGADPVRYPSLAIGRDDTIYISYRDADDGSLKVAVGHADQVLESKR